MKTEATLVQRFLDQELSAGRAGSEFIVALGRDRMLRERVLRDGAVGARRLEAAEASRSRWICRTGHGVLLRAARFGGQADDAGEAGRCCRTMELSGRGIVGATGAASGIWPVLLAIACLALIAIGGGATEALRWRDASAAASTASATAAATPPVVLVGSSSCSRAPESGSGRR